MKRCIASSEIASAERLPEDRSELGPMERRVDTVLAMTAADGQKFVLACEAQGGHSKVTVQNKRRNWPYYLAHLHEQYKLPVVLVVLCQEKTTVKWAREPINIGLDLRRIALTVEQRERILGCTDLENYRRWLGATMTATSADEIFG